jgi:hypothetical protein
MDCHGKGISNGHHMISGSLHKRISKPYALSPIPWGSPQGGGSACVTGLRPAAVSEDGPFLRTAE